MGSEAAARIAVGRVAGVFGVRGWVKVQSDTEPRDNILSYTPWYLRIGDQWRPLKMLEGQAHGQGVIARLETCETRDDAARLVGAEIAIDRDQLGSAGSGEYYWVDLIGLRVVNREGIELGVVDHLLETGANDVLVVHGERERLIPYTPGEAVLEVDLDARRIRVDWDADF